MGTANNLNQLFKMMEKHIGTALIEDVAPVAKNTLKEHVVEDIYDKYTPSHYQRSGGLLQDKNIEVVMENDNTLSVRSTRNEDGRDIAEIIEYGKGYSYQGLDERIGARPFHAEAARELDEKGLGKKAMRDGLRKQGLNVE